MTHPQTPPALSAEEWKARSHQFTSSPTEGVSGGNGQIAIDRGQWDAPDCHAIAALCLYEQPFGFTQEDVDALQDAICPLGEHAHYDYEALADRIAALLPPPPSHP